MTFLHPVWLLAIVPALLLAVIEARRRWSAPARRKAVAIACRVLVLAALASAAADPRWHGEQDEATVVFLIDRSASVSDDDLAAAWDKARAARDRLGSDRRTSVVAFDADAEVIVAPGDPWPSTPTRAALGSRDATDIARAIKLGLSLIPDGTAGHLVLVSDGRSNAGELSAASRIAARRRVPISSIPSGGALGDPAIASVALDSDRVKSGATVTGYVDVDAGGVTGRRQVAVQVGGTEVVRAAVELRGGHERVPFTYALPATQATGPLDVTATLVIAPADPNPDTSNDRGATTLVVEPPPRIVIIDGDEGGAEPLAKALRAEQMDVVVTPAVGGTKPDLSATDLVILANAPVGMDGGREVVDDALGERLVRWVNDGGGLIVLGGPSSLDAKYAANWIAESLPVEIEPMTPAIDSSATVIAILDQSGSMGEMVGGRTKLALAAEGVIATLRMLRSFDKVAVAAVQEHVDWVVPMSPVGDTALAMEAKVRAIYVGGGGINVYTSLVEAQKVMEKATTPIKHVILFSDTWDAAEQVKDHDYGGFYGWPYSKPNSLTVAKQLKDAGITLSVIGVGEGNDGGFSAATYEDDDDDSDFLRQLAKDGGGRYYRTTDANQLRALFIQDARRVLDSKAREAEIALDRLAAHAAFDGIDIEAAPNLAGYQQVKPRPAAQVVLAERKQGDPIFTRWSYGLGEVVVWASDAGPRWATNWASWSGYTRFWTQLSRSALRRREGDATAIEADVSRDRATVRVVRRDERTDAPPPRVRTVDGPASRDLSLRVVEPGTYEAVIDVAPGTAPTLELVDGNEVTARRTVVRPPSVELAQRGPDMATLEQLASQTGGAVSPTTIASATRPRPSSTPLAPWFALLAILLIPIDAGLRRAARDRNLAVPA